MKKSPDYWIDHLALEPHPEGGFFKETYRSNSEVDPIGFEGKRSVSTGIYFLLTQGNFSAFHKIRSDEMWHFYSGDPVHVFVIRQDGRLEEIVLGLDLEAGQVPQAVVPANCWFASRVDATGDYGLVGCTVAPGFDFQDFEMAARTKLINEYPEHTELITQLTRL